MRTHTTILKAGINHTPEFEKKGLAWFAVNVGTECGHDCTCCSRRMGSRSVRWRRGDERAGISGIMALT